ncbi:MAG: cell division protein SepF [Oscillospiraceae bacterium]|nr:cell division protein SepF [Oscillospiraceae bacterium]
MGFMDGLKKLTQPYDDEEDFFEGSDQSLRPQPKSEQKAVSAAQMAFENAFADPGGAPAPAEEAAPKKPAEGSGGGIFGGFKKAAQGNPRPRREKTMNFGGRDTSVILFSPKTFDEAGELVGYLQQDATCVMTLESVPAETARRLLDFLSGIAFALGGRITPVSAKTYFITPQNVDIQGLQPQQQTEQQPENSGHYF